LDPDLLERPILILFEPEGYSLVDYRHPVRVFILKITANFVPKTNACRLCSQIVRKYFNLSAESLLG